MKSLGQDRFCWPEQFGIKVHGLYFVKTSVAKVVKFKPESSRKFVLPANVAAKYVQARAASFI